MASPFGYPGPVTRFLRPERGPTTLKETRWGGTRLARLRGVDPSRRIGESWEFSCLPGHESRAAGQPLSAALASPLPFLAKLIDTAIPLSVQVHPGDSADRSGKEEAWVILDAEPGAMLWVGLGDTCTPASFRTAVTTGAPLLPYLRSIPAVPGLVVLVPARTVHAIGGGILLAEIQQPSDCTYRFYDHGSDRPIHREQALATVDLAARPLLWHPGQPPTVLDGRHIHLQVLGPGTSQHDAEVPQLIIPVTGAVNIHANDEHLTLTTGELALVRPGPWHCDIEASGLGIVGHASQTAL